jgi:chromosome segregation ATPase
MVDEIYMLQSQISVLKMKSDENERLRSDIESMRNLVQTTEKTNSSLVESLKLKENIPQQQSTSSHLLKLQIESMKNKIREYETTIKEFE